MVKMTSESDAHFAQVFRQDHSVWLDSLAVYLEEVKPDSLSFNGLGIGAVEVELLLKLISNSQVTKLNLKNNYLEDGVEVWSELLKETNVKKLNVTKCDLHCPDVLHLIGVCKEIQMSDLKISGNELVESFDDDGVDEIIDFLCESHIKTFDLGTFYLTKDSSIEDGIHNVLQAIPNTSLTSLDISFCEPSEENLIFLFSNLRHTSITDLTLCEGIRAIKPLKELSRNLRLSKLEKLNLSWSGIDDDGVDILAKGLRYSKIVSLDLSRNPIHGLNTLGLHLKDTCIKTLNLAKCSIKHHGIFLAANFLRNSCVVDLILQGCKLNDKFCQKLLKSLKYSKVTNLSLAGNNITLPTVSKFVEIVKDTNLEYIDFSDNNLSLDALILLGKCMKGSKITQINFCRNSTHSNGGVLFSAFLEKAKNHSSASCNRKNLYQAKAKYLVTHLNDTAHFGLNLTANKIGDGVLSLAEHLKFSALMYLCLTENLITDEGVEALAQSLKETQLIGLYLGGNNITSRGAKMLALSLKDSSLLYLRLWRNQIENDGINVLAQNAEDTFITILDVSHNPGDRVFLIEAVLWRNKISVHRLVSAFNQIAPQTSGTNFQFSKVINDENICTLLENCLQLYKMILEKPSSVSVLLEAKSISLSKESIISLMLEEFPNQFCLFVMNEIEADVKQHVSLLKRAEDLALNNITESLLLHRPKLTIDKKKEILHPYIYQLLFKYKHPLYNLDIEPQGRVKIINYFTEHPDIEGASDVISLLRGKRKH